MRTTLMQAGYDKLITTNDPANPRLKFTGFQTGSEVGFTPSPLTTEAIGGDINNYTHTAMRYLPINEHSITLVLLVDRVLPEHVVGNVMIFVDEEPFAMSVLDAETHKLHQDPTNAGSLFTLQILLRLPQLVSRFDLTNLEAKPAQFSVLPNANSLKASAHELRDQMMIDQWRDWVQPIPVLNVSGRYFANPLMKRIGSANFGRIDGGTVGDLRKGE